ncbi:MAG: right-handed parallel beta-helix repeat-containing protein, partial [Gammaproteobacteria bacterium]
MRIAAAGLLLMICAAPTGVAAAVVIDTATDIPANDSTLDGQDIVVEGVALTINGAHTIKTLQIQTGAAVRLSGNVGVETITVDAGGTLTLSAGARLRFADGHKLSVSGTLRIEDSVGNPVVLTSAQSTPAVGDWGGIEINSSATNVLLSQFVVEYATAGIDVNSYAVTEIHYCTLRHNEHGIKFRRGLSTVQGCLIANNTVSGVHTYGWGTVPQVSGNTLRANQRDGIHIDYRSTPMVEGNVITRSEHGIYITGYAGQYSSNDYDDRYTWMWPLEPEATVTGNAITDNNYGIYVSGKNYGVVYDPDPIVTGNDIYDNDLDKDGKEWNYFTWDFVAPTSTALTATGNWWGTRDPVKIAGTVGDQAHNTDESTEVDYSGYLTGPIAGANEAVIDIRGPVGSTAKWTPGEVYQLWGPLVVPAGEVVTIPDGVVLRGPAGSADVYVSGTLALEGDVDVHRITVAASGTLTLPAGVQLRFAPDGKLSVDGTLRIEGTASDPVKLTSARAEPAAGDWQGVEITPSATGVVLSQLLVEYSRDGIAVNSDAVTEIRDCTLRYNEVGVQFWRGASKVERCVIADNDAGVYVESSDASPQVFGNTLRRNKHSGISISRRAYPVVTGNIVTDNGHGVHVYVDTYGPDGWPLAGRYDPAPTVTGNDIFDNDLDGDGQQWNYFTDDFGESSSSITVFTATGNWWGTTDPLTIAATVQDQADNAYSSSWVDYSGYLTASITAGGEAVVEPGDIRGAVGSSTQWTPGEVYRLWGPLVVPAGEIVTIPGDVELQWPGGDGDVYVHGTLALSGNMDVTTISVDTAGTLTLPAGTRLRFAAGGKLTVNGTLTTQGTASDPVVLTSAQSEPAAGDWQGIEINRSATNVVLSHVIVEYAVNGVDVNSDAAAQVSDCTLRYNEYGIRFQRGASKVERCVITGNEHGVYVFGDRYGYDDRFDDTADPQPVVTGNDIYGNDLDGDGQEWNYVTYNFSESATTVLNATGNWWGTRDFVAIADTLRDSADNAWGAAWVDYSSYLGASITAGGEAVVEPTDIRGPVRSSTQWVPGEVYRLWVPLVVPAGEIVTIPAGVELQWPGSGGDVYVYGTLALSGNVGVETITVGRGGALTLTAGTKLRFAANGKLSVSGTLKIEGTESEPVVLTSAQTEPAAGDWQGITIEPSATDVVLSQLVVEYAATGVTVNNDAVTEVRDCTLRHNNYGIRFRRGASKVERCVIADNRYSGVYVYWRDTSPQVLGNTVQGNGNHGVYIEAGAEPVLAANVITGNGHGVYVSGRSHNPHPTVTGNDIYGNDLDGDGQEWNYFTSDFTDRTTTVLAATGNWWGTQDPTAIAATVRDYADDANESPWVDYGGYLDDSITAGGAAVVGPMDIRGPVNAAAVWTPGAVYRLWGPLVVPAGEVVTIPAGVELQWQAGSADVHVDGTLVLGERALGSIGIGAGGTLELTGRVDLDTVTVDAGGALVLSEGAQLRFAAGERLWVNGTLKIEGTEAAPVLLTSAQTTPAAGDWQGIEITASATDVVLSQFVVEYARNGVHVNSDAVTQVRDCTLRHNEYGIQFRSGASTVEGCTITDNKYSGVYTHGSGTAPQVTGNTLQRNQGYGVHVDAYSQPVVTGNVITDNGHGVYASGYRYNRGDKGYNPRPVVTGNDIYGNDLYGRERNYRTWNFAEGATTVLPATGNWWGTTDPVVIAGTVADYEDNTSESAWVDYSGYLTGSISDGGEAVQVEPSDIRGPVSSSTQWTPGEVYRLWGPLVVPAGEAVTIPADVELDWLAGDGGAQVYGTLVLSGNRGVKTVTVDSAGTLTLAAGTQLRFAAGGELSVNGVLKIEGNESDPVVLTSAQTEPAAGDWRGISIYSGATGAVLSHLVVEYAGTGVHVHHNAATEVRDCTLRYNECGIRFIYSASRIERCVVTDNTHSGVYTYGSGAPQVLGNTLQRNQHSGVFVEYISKPVVSGNVITDNKHGVYVSNDAGYRIRAPAPVVTGNDIYGNDLDGDGQEWNYYTWDFSEGATTVLTATGNWWGTTDPPMISGTVGDYLDNNNESARVDFRGYLDGSILAGGQAVSDVTADDTTPGPVSVSADGAGDGKTAILDWSGYDEIANGHDILFYTVYAATSGFTETTAATPLVTLPAGTKGYSATGLARGQPHYFAVTATDFVGNVLTGVNPVAVTPTDAQPPADVTQLQVQSFENALVLSWAAPPDDDLGGFRLRHSDTDAVIDLPATATRYELAPLDPATRYTVSIVSADEDGNAGAGVTVNAVTWLANPTGLSAQPYSGQITLSWAETQPAELVKHYALYAEQTPFTSVAGLTPRLTVGPGRTSGKLAGLTNDTEYFVAVTTVNVSAGERDSVTTVSAVPAEDTAGPTLSHIRFAGQPLSSGQTIGASGPVSARAADPAGVARVEFVLDGVLLATGATSGGEYRAHWNIEQTSDGPHKFTVRAFDTVGNQSDATVDVTVAMTVPGTPTITQPADGHVTNESLGVVAGTADALTDGVVFYVNDQQLEGAATVNPGGAYSRGLELQAGENRIQVAARNRGGLSARSPEVVVTLDTSIPDEPSGLTARGRDSGEIVLTWSAIDEDASGVKVYRSTESFATIDKAEQVNTGLTAGNSFNDLPPADGVYYYRIVAVNAAGTASGPSDEATARADGTPPRAVAIEYQSSGPVDVESGRMGPGEVQVQVTVNEPLLTTPFLSLTPNAGVPISVRLNRDSDTVYTGTFTIT